MKMSGIEAVGDVVTGGLLAHSVEPNSGDTSGHTHEKFCLNCRAPLVGPYCAECGQKAHVHRSVRGFSQDFVQGLFNFEGKIWRTLPMLTWRPGEMTRRYIAGERARFVSPIALYLFTVFAMFAVLNFTGALNPGGGKGIKNGLKSEIAEKQKQLAALTVKRNLAVADGKSSADLDSAIANDKHEIAANENLLNGQPPVSANVDKDVPRWIRPLVQNAISNPDTLSMKIQDAASKYSWMLIPISLPFMWLLFPFRRRYNMYDHAVFVTYSLSFMMMLVIAGGLLVTIGLASAASLLFFVPPVHMYRHLKQSYELGRASAIIKTFALVTFAFIAAALFAAATVAIGSMD